MRTSTRVQLVAGLILALALGASAMLTVRIAASAGRNQLTYTSKAEAGMSRDEAVGIALGAFRGLFVNWLWIRANELKEAGKYYEAVDLARTITRLQPRFPRVWAFHAWNLAYNISVATQTAGERWQWVSAGIRLLRDEGIPANPSDLLLHKELAWIYLHKVQGVMDDANQFYKRAFAREWTVVLGPPPPRSKDTRTFDAAVAKHVEWLKRISDAKPTFDEALSANPTVPQLVQRLKSLAGVDVATAAGGHEVLRTVEHARSAFKRMEAFGMGGQVPEELNQEIVKALGDPAMRPGWEILVPHLRRRTLVDGYHMEPDRMIRYTQKYGPLDWRHPAAHSLYWSARGVEMALIRLNERNAADLDFVNTDRITLQSLQELFRSGQVMFDVASPDLYAQIPSADFIYSYKNAIDDMIGREADQMAVKGVDMRKRVFTFYGAAYENFMSDAICFLYRRGQKEEALRMKVALGQWEGINLNDLEKLHLIREAPLDEYVLQMIKERATSPYLARLEVYASLTGAFINGLLTGDEELFRSQFAYAQLMHKTYTDEQIKRNSVDPEKSRMEEMDRDFKVEAAKAFVNMSVTVGPFDSAIMYQRTPDDLRKAIFYLMEKAKVLPVKEDGTPATPELAKLFPTPPDYAPYRALREQQDAARRIENPAGKQLH